MRARLHDPAGPLRARLAPWAVGLVTLAIGLGVAVHFRLYHAGAALFALAVTLGHIRLLSPRRFAPRDAEIVASPGFVRVAIAGQATRIVTARDLRGASVAPIPFGESLMLAPRGRGVAPIVFEIEGLENAASVRTALGLGDGFGVVRWTTAPRGLDYLKSALLVASLGLWGLAAMLLGATATIGLSDDIATVASAAFVIALPFTCLALPIAFLAAWTAGPGIELTGDGLVIVRRASRTLVSYREILLAVRARGGIRINRRDGASPLFAVALPVAAGKRGITYPEQEEIARHITAAANRAQHPPRAAVSALARGDDSRAAWIARLDGLPAALRGAAGYRAASLDEETLWSALENPNAAIDDRAAAARILSRLEPTRARPRIDAAIAAMHDEQHVRDVRRLLDADVEDGGAPSDSLKTKSG